MDTVSLSDAKINDERKFDVFLSFRGEDTREKFVSHLYEALIDARIVAFKDDRHLLPGGEISSELGQAIRSSRISVVVFSVRYADSSWCLDELAEIMKSRIDTGQLVIPVFYGVDVQDVRHQTCHFAKAFVEHGKRPERLEKLGMWRSALAEASRLMGLQSHGYEDEAMLVKRIVYRTQGELRNQTLLPLSRFPVGLGSDLPVEVSHPSTLSKRTHSLRSLSLPLLSQPMASSPCQSPNSKHLTYDVFISYRGTDTRGKFASHLYHALKGAGINAFMAGETLPLGEDISLALFQAIRSSRSSLVIFSEHFADSPWCLDELAEIMKWKQLVLPVFYHIDPSNVRKQSGKFGEAFKTRDRSSGANEAEKVVKWRAALTQAGKISGWDVKPGVSNEATIIKEIVRRISIVIDDRKHLDVAEYPVGLDSRVRDLNKYLLDGSDAVRFVGIQGMGGIGKSTVAKAVYNQLNHLFESKSFLADVRVTSERCNNVVTLQQQLLDDILKLKDGIAIRNVDDGISMLKERLKAKKALVILDDVTDSDQIKKLAGAREWFGHGSRIIITTRDPHLLKAIDEVDYIYDAKPLNPDESIELFCSHAFREHHPKEEFTEPTTIVLNYCKGVPLALQVLGASLRRKNVEEWIVTLAKLKVIPDCKIQTQLRVSFDSLGNDDRVKELFLDIACFFVGWDKDYVVRILESCGLFAKKGICDLIDRCLIQVDENNKLKMHDLLRDMGREIVRGESHGRPEKRSRLWFREDVLSALRSHLGGEKVTGIALDLSESDNLKLSGNAFAMMKRLRLLKLNHVHVDGEYGHISRELRWLCWHNFPLEFIPDDFYLGQLVAIDMQYSNLRQVWKNNKHLEKLKTLNLSHSHSLTRTPNFSMLPNLEELILEDCAELVYVHPSIGQLGQLDLVNFKDCKKLKNFPGSLCRSKSLRKLEISGCSKIDKLPENLEQMESLTTFIADAIPIAQVPLSIASLKKLTHFSLCGCKRSSSLIYSFVRSLVPTREIPECSTVLITLLSGLSSLKELKLMDCDLLGVEIPDDIGGFLSLENLDLRNNTFRSLPDTICQLTTLKTLQLDECRSLVSVPDMPPSLLSLSAINCDSLESISFSQFGSGTRLFLTNCNQLKTIEQLDDQVLDGIIHLEQCVNLTAALRDFILKDWCGSAFLPGNRIPDWFDYTTTGSSLSFEIPTLQEGIQLKGFTICVIYASTTDNLEMQPYPRFSIDKFNMSFSAPTQAKVAITPDDHLWVFHSRDFITDDRFDFDMDKVKIDAEFGPGWSVKGLGIHFRKEKVPNRKRHRIEKEVAQKKYPKSQSGYKKASETSH